jgi:hypothetical protein
MTTYKNTSGNYTITIADGLGNMTVNGNLNVAGNVTYIDVSELIIQDPFIVLNASNSNVYLSNSGVLTHTTSSIYAGIRYNATSTQWEISNNTTTGVDGTWTNIATGNAGVAGSNTQIQFNDSSNFGASANLTFDKSNSQLFLQGHLGLGNIGATPLSVANATVMYSNTVGDGGTGVYVKSSAVDSELVSNYKAIVYGIIF